MKALNWVNKFSAVRTRACGADCTFSVWAAGSRANKSTGKENGRAHAEAVISGGRGTWADADSFTRLTIHADAEDEEFWKTPVAWRYSIQSENACELSVLHACIALISIAGLRSSCSKTHRPQLRDREDTTGAGWLKFYHGTTRLLETRAGTMHTCIYSLVHIFFFLCKKKSELYWVFVFKRTKSLAHNKSTRSISSTLASEILSNPIIRRFDLF